ncbi:OmpH family outer membrane protein [uncultured Arcticibacterium sp.]|uniref:OmpH family outer membrane protein n=1 Tax=uncultured Arcticibacterium sp. TaxID=2173042 RepID=UPI0030F813EB
MKIKLFATLFAALMLAGIGANAQVKIGYTNIDYILTNLPDSKEIQEKLTTEKAQYDKLLQEKVAEFQKSYENYQKNAATMTPVIRQDKEKSLQTAQTGIQEFQQNSEVAIQNKQRELLAPVMDKIQVAIDEVAKANGYTHVLNSDAGYGTTPVILVAPDSDNITVLVFKHMGVTPPEDTEGN